MEQHNSHEEEKPGFVGTVTNPDAAGTFAFLYVLVAISFIASLLIFG